MGVSTEIVAKACERVFARVCEIGRSVPPETPAAGFLAAAARNVDEAQARLTALRGPDEIDEVLAPLRRAGALLGDVQRMEDRRIDGLERVSVIVDGICVTLEIDRRQELRGLRARGDADGTEGPANT